MAISTTGSASKGWAPDVIAVPAQDAVPDLLAITASTVAGRVQGDEPYVRVPYVDDAAAAIVAEGAAITESDPTLSEVAVQTVKVAQLLKVSRELYSQTTTAGLLSGSVSRAITRKANAQFITTVTGTTGIGDAGTVTASLDELVDAVAAIEADGGTATNILCAPDTWAELRKLKTATGSNASLIGAGTDDAARMLLSLPVTVDAALASGAGLVLDRTAIVSAIGAVQVSVSEDAYFANDAVGIRATLRVGSVLAKTARAQKFAVTIGE